MSEYLNEVFGGLTDLGDVHYTLMDLGHAFSKTGNEHMAVVLYDCAVSVKEACDRIRSAVGKDVNDEFKASQQSIGKTISALLEAQHD